MRIAGAVELVEGIELRLDGVVATECTFEIGCVRFVDRFAIPTCAFGIDFVEMFLILLLVHSKAVESYVSSILSSWLMNLPVWEIEEA